MKFSFFTDPHITDNRPCHRIDDYVYAIPQKIEKVYNLSVNNGCQFVACGGDIFDRHIVPVFDIINFLEDVMMKSGLKTYTCIGEHDLYGHSPKTFPTSTLGHLVKHTPSLNVLWEKVDLPDGVTLYGKHEWQTMEEISKIEVDPKRYNILICHELLYNKKMPFSIVYTKDLVLPFDLVCSGDLHCGFEPHKVGKTWYCNPGSLARKATSDTKRMPKMLFIECYKGHDPYIREQIIPQTKPGKEVFATGIAETIRKFESEIDMKKFAQGFDEIVSEKTDIYELFSDYIQANPTKPDVLQYMKEIRERIGK